MGCGAIALGQIKKVLRSSLLLDLDSLSGFGTFLFLAICFSGVVNFSFGRSRLCSVAVGAGAGLSGAWRLAEESAGIGDSAAG